MQDWGPTSAFGPNEQAEYIGILARELGFTAMILEWRGSRKVDVFVPLSPTSSSSLENSASLEISSDDYPVYAPVLAAAVLAAMLVLVKSGQNFAIDAITSRWSLPALEVHAAAPSSVAQQE